MLLFESTLLSLLKHNLLKIRVASYSLLFALFSSWAIGLMNELDFLFGNDKRGIN